jgi:hypothetical protein
VQRGEKDQSFINIYFIEMVECLNTVVQILIFLIGIIVIAAEILQNRKKTSIICKKRISRFKYILGAFLIVLSIITWRCSIIIGNRNLEVIENLETNVEILKPRLKILDIYPSETQKWSGQLTVNVGSDANQKIDEFSFEIEFDRPFIEAKFNYSWDLPSKKGTKYFEPEILAKNSRTFSYESQDPLPSGFIVHFIFTSERPLIIKSTKLSP